MNGVHKMRVVENHNAIQSQFLLHKRENILASPRLHLNIVHCPNFNEKIDEMHVIYSIACKSLQLMISKLYCSTQLKITKT